MSDYDMMKKHDRYMTFVASKLDLEIVADAADEIFERLEDVAEHCSSTDKWCDAVENAVCETVEYMNLCIYMCNGLGHGTRLVNSGVISLVVTLCDLKHCVAGMKDIDDRREALVEQIERAIHAAGDCIIVQDEKYWLCMGRLFGLDVDEIVKACAETANDEQSEPESGEESEFEKKAIEILKEAMEQPVGTLSTSWIQRRFSCGYGMAAKILDWLEDRGYVQSEDEMKAEELRGRRILVTKEMPEK